MKKYCRKIFSLLNICLILCITTIGTGAFADTLKDDDYYVSRAVQILTEQGMQRDYILEMFPKADLIIIGKSEETIVYEEYSVYDENGGKHTVSEKEAIEIVQEIESQRMQPSPMDSFHNSTSVLNGNLVFTKQPSGQYQAAFTYNWLTEPTNFDTDFAGIGLKGVDVLNKGSSYSRGDCYQLVGTNLNRVSAKDKYTDYTSSIRTGYNYVYFEPKLYKPEGASSGYPYTYLNQRGYISCQCIPSTPTTANVAVYGAYNHLKKAISVSWSLHPDSLDFSCGIVNIIGDTLKVGGIISV